MEKPPKHDKFLIFKKNLNLQIHQWPSKVLQKGAIYASPNLNLCKKKPQPLPSYGGLYIKVSNAALNHGHTRNNMHASARKFFQLTSSNHPDSQPPK